VLAEVGRVHEGNLVAHGCGGPSQPPPCRQPWIVVVDEVEAARVVERDRRPMGVDARVDRLVGGERGVARFHVPTPRPVVVPLASWNSRLDQALALASK